MMSGPLARLPGRELRTRLSFVPLLELSPLAERAGGDHRAGDVSLSASSVWEGVWTPQGDPLQIFDERLHPLHAGAAPGRACATPSVSAVKATGGVSVLPAQT